MPQPGASCCALAGGSHLPCTCCLPAEAAKDVVLAEKPTISGAEDAVEPGLLRELLAELGSLASVYHKPAGSFVSKLRLAVHRADDLAAVARASGSGDSGGWGDWVGRLKKNEGGLVVSGTAPHKRLSCCLTAYPPAAVASPPAPPPAPPAEMLTAATVAESPMGSASAGATPTAAAAAPVPDLLGDLPDLDVPAPAPAAAPAAAAAAAASNLPVVFGEDKGKGVVLRARMAHTAAEGFVYEVRRLPTQPQTALLLSSCCGWPVMPDLLCSADLET